MTITQTLRRLAERAYARAHGIECEPQTIIAMCDVVDAANQVREATRKYERVSLETICTGSPEWQEASLGQLIAERELDLALEALAKVEG